MKRKAKVLLTILIIVVVLILIAVAIYFLMNARGFQFFGKLVNCVDTENKVIYLTFDDGPTRNTQRVLNKLDELDVKATFFLIGRSMEESPELTRQILDAGHEIGNHSYTHTPLVLRSLSEIKNEVDSTNEIIRSFGYTQEIFFRPPNGKKLILLPWYLSQIG